MVAVVVMVACWGVLMALARRPGFTPRMEPGVGASTSGEMVPRRVVGWGAGPRAGIEVGMVLAEGINGWASSLQTPTAQKVTAVGSRRWGGTSALVVGFRQKRISVRWTTRAGPVSPTCRMEYVALSNSGQVTTW